MNVNRVSVVAMLALTACALVFSGCDETDLANALFSITPDQVTLTEDGQTVVLQAKGGSEPLTWTVSDDSMGAVSGVGRVVTYTRANKVGANTVTVTDDSTWTASALIIQEDALGGIAITPQQVTLSGNGDKTVFTVTGGTKPYAWTVGISSGAIAPSGDSQALYTRLAEGNNSVIVTDQAGRVVVAQVIQPDVPALAVSPSVASVSAANGTQIFTAVGGTGAYTWSIVAPQNGTLSNPTGANTVYTSVGLANDVVSLSDGVSTVFATVKKL